MDRNRRPRAVPLLAGLAALAAGYGFWVWFVERVEVPPGKFLVRAHLVGKNLPEGEILAPDPSYKGILADPLPEGRYFLNPLFWAYEVHDMTDVPAGKCAVQTRLFGKPAAGVLAEDGERGILRQVLMPGKYRVNPHAYSVQVVDAVEIGPKQAGVRTLKVGVDYVRDLKKEGVSPYVVPEGYRGTQEKPVSSGTYYLNPYVESVVPIDVRSHRIEFTDIEFPSRDGYLLKPHVFVTYHVIPAKAPDLWIMMTDNGKLSQDDSTPEQMDRNQILQKVVLPLVRGYVRIEGSKFDARDFVSSPTAGVTTNARERLQTAMREKITPLAERAGVFIESVTVAQMDVPPELADLIAQREIARVEREKNADKIEQLKTEQTLKATEALKAQNTKVGEANTRRATAETRAKQLKEVEEAKLKQDLANAALAFEAARDTARKVLAIAKAEAEVIERQNEAEVAGLRRAIQGFPSAEVYAQAQVLARLAPALAEIFASDTSEFGRMFAGYMAGGGTKPDRVMPPATTPPSSAVAGAGN